MWAGADIDPAATITDAVFQHYYSQLIYGQKVSQLCPRFQAPSPELGATDIGLPTVNLSRS